MSVFSTLFAFEKKTKILAFMTARQAQLLLYYFKAENLLPYLRILETHYPDYKEFYWDNPFPMGHHYSKDYSNDTIWNEMAVGHSIEMGYFDNELQTYAKYLPILRNIFQIRNEILK